MISNQGEYRTKSSIRIFHAIPDISSVGLYINNMKISDALHFTEITCYNQVSSGKYNIKVKDAENIDEEIFSKNIDILPNKNKTLILVKTINGIDLLVLDDGEINNNVEDCLLRFINLSSNCPLLNLSFREKETLFEGVEYLEKTKYCSLKAGIQNLRISLTSSDRVYKNLSNLNLEKGKAYTIYTVGFVNKRPLFGYILTQDKKIEM